MTDLYGDVYSDFYGSLLPDGFRVEVDWDADGDFASYLENVTPQVRRDSPISLSYGRDQSSALSATTAGSGGFTLDNRSRMYSPRNTASPLYGYLQPARPVKITRTIGGATYTLFRGHTDDSPINPDVEAKTVTFSLLDDLADFRGYEIRTALHRGIRTGEATGLILDACGWPADKRDLDPGGTVIQWWWEDGTDALTAMEKIVQSEGLPSYVTMGADGEVIFRDRHHRMLRPASLTSQGTWRGSGRVEPVMARGFAYDEAWKNIVNTGTRSVDVRAGQDLQVVWSSDASLTFSAGEQKLITASTTEPVYGAVTPVGGTDFTVLSGTVTAALLRTSGGSIGIRLTADSGGPARIAGLQLRAHPVAVVYAVDVSSVDTGSAGSALRSRSMTTEIPWANADDTQAILDLTVAQRSRPLTLITAPFIVGTNVARAAATLARDLSDRVTVIEPETCVSGDFFVEAIRHEFSSDFDHKIIFDVEAVLDVQANVARADIAGVGSDQGVAGNGMDYPSTLALTDSNVVGQRVDEGLVAK